MGSIVFVNAMFTSDRESFLRMVHLENVQPLHGCWEEGHEWEGLKTQQNSGQIELITQFLQDYLTNRKNATPERLLRSQQRWKELSTEVAVISRLKTQTRQSQLVRDAFVSLLVFNDKTFTYTYPLETSEPSDYIIHHSFSCTA